MAAQGTAQTAVKAAQATPIKNTTQVAPASTTVVKQETQKMTINKETLTELVEKGMSLRTMATKLNAKVSEVRKALIEFGLETKSMKSVGSKKASTIQMFNIICSIKRGAGSEEAIVKETGLNEAVVKNTVKKLKKDGLVKNAITFVEPDQPENASPTA